MLFLFLLFLMLSNSLAISSTHSINTRFNKKSDIINFLTSPKFYHKYLDEVEAEERKFDPEIIDNNTQIEFPQRISYFSKPRVRLLKSMLSKLKIDQEWNRTNDKFFGNIKTKFIEFDITIEPILNGESNFTCKKYDLCFNGKIIRKKFYVPERYLDEILKDFGDIFIKISNTTE